MKSSMGGKSRNARQLMSVSGMQRYSECEFQGASISRLGGSENHAGVSKADASDWEFPLKMGKNHPKMSL
ncbi:hypothetical protein [Burkholderia gladioli]|uniref:hypothetical protein n=1 Tax=Burkholderia gladioli TaxID=28095 RepID=UPI000F80BDC7|nr:hypothetical protein [Burkholderia gladioli]